MTPNRKEIIRHLRKALAADLNSHADFRRMRVATPDEMFSEDAFAAYFAALDRGFGIPSEHDIASTGVPKHVAAVTVAAIDGIIEEFANTSGCPVAAIQDVLGMGDKVAAAMGHRVASSNYPELWEFDGLAESLRQQLSNGATKDALLESIKKALVSKRYGIDCPQFNTCEFTRVEGDGWNEPQAQTCDYEGATYECPENEPAIREAVDDLLEQYYEWAEDYHNE